MIEDEKIIELFFVRSEQGIRELDIKYGKVFHKLSYNILNSRQDAEECVNDAYLGAWNAIPPAKPSPLLAFICKIVRNISLKIHYRKEAAKRNSTYTIAMEEMEACIADPNTVEAEVDAYGFDTLGEYLPASLPDGYHFEKADLYETTMKDGTVILCSVCNIPQAMILHRETQERKLLLTPILLAIVWWSYFPYFLWRHLYWDFSRYSNYRRYSCSGRFHKVKEP